MNPVSTLPSARSSLALFGAAPWRAAMTSVSLKLTGQKPAHSGDGHPVLIFPGLASDSTPVATLRDHCASLGYNALAWDRGYARGPHGGADVWLAALASQVAAQLAKYDQRATLIGCSQGGLYAHELGKLLAPQLRQIITIGQPWKAVADPTDAGSWLRSPNGAAAHVGAALSERLRTPPPVPTTSIHSRSDGASWPRCRHDEASKWVQEIEVSDRPGPTGWSPSVLHIVAERLAQRPGAWRRYPVIG